MLKTAQDVNLYLSAKKAVIISNRPKILIFSIIGAVILTYGITVTIFILKSLILSFILLFTWLILSIKIGGSLYTKDNELKTWINFCDERSIVIQSKDYVGIKSAIEDYISRE